MKSLILAIITTTVLGAADTTRNVDSLAVAPEFTGNCASIVSFALGQKPALASDDYYVESAVDVSQDMKVSWNIGSAGSFDGDGRVGKITSDANCLRPEVIEDRVKDKVSYYQKLLAYRQKRKQPATNIWMISHFKPTRKLQIVSSAILLLRLKIHIYQHKCLLYGGSYFCHWYIWAATLWFIHWQRGQIPKSRQERVG
ncbi:MAG: hypothetical protein A2023_07160 [Sulfuricurvum sp. GWF2_44_89]|uniref:Uncharacterized protein n=1 Tax=Sulfuricurvum kujiense TaxID=148813 RepID=A0A2D3WQ65_9BACT|nr:MULTISPECIES: hypothetical protein [Sulfuricurvum]OHD78256.1 MAG: hypothetical protein A2023_07160 [Sulfuricurvum sp. GWF2_44_89]OHD91563.1 MAG: hypothetical protein A2517_07100 [Sulfuricurvum sp. RIFOXYD12_FULL_44_77]OHD94149.1 MAG: hypothetical protein A2552_01765 [Sulfuricurvum sp. RIFOXYD2_FULL_44_160]DAB38843.1 MAG TPA: hypothetical protein CFH83_03775 [Sulfuricurvum kujiense]